MPSERLRYKYFYRQEKAGARIVSKLAMHIVPTSHYAEPVFEVFESRIATLGTTPTSTRRPIHERA